MTAVAELNFGTDDVGEVVWRVAGLQTANALLGSSHYLGPRHASLLTIGGFLGGEVVAAQLWSLPTARFFPADGSWLELSRWCLTRAAGENAGSRMHAAAVRMLRERFPRATTLLSYSDPSAGHSGALYRACNWLWAPTWHRLRPPPSGLGSWDGATRQEVKDRWVFPLRRDRGRAALLTPDDPPAVRAYVQGEEWRLTTHRWRAAVDLAVLAEEDRCPT